ncbi:MAG: DUF3488 and transglutaminase-like domain-containing protein [Pyrinomonadaceae bacterium]
MINSEGKIDRYFQTVSYMAAVCSFAALFSSGAIGIPITLLTVLAVIAAWSIEGTKWQLSEKMGLGVITGLILLFFIDLKFSLFGSRTIGTIPIGSLGWLIACLCLVKLVQLKTDRDWIFIYIISFFELLLAAGLSISPLFVIYFLGFLIFVTCAFISLDIRRTLRATESARRIILPKGAAVRGPAEPGISIRKFSSIGISLLILIGILALPLFYLFPRDSAGGFGTSLTGNAISGFSGSVRLGEIGILKQSDEVVMRVKVEGGSLPESGFYWKGITLDQFDNRRWRRSDVIPAERPIRGTNNTFKVNAKIFEGENVTQKFYLEPIGNSTIFALSKPLALQGYFHTIRKSGDDSLRSDKVGFERTNYTVVSDPAVPPVSVLRNDTGSNGGESLRYLQLPEDIDPRISKLASEISRRSDKRNIYDISKTFEGYLRSEFGYSLEMKASGEQPLSDFLFNVREGHCEYFASAMAIMLRTQGIATRIVNGFQQGDYNESADMYVVRQRDAHSWVEVYFPETKSWVKFDPTPSAGRYSESAAATVWDKFGKYTEALEMIWIRYFVSYDSQEQSGLISSLKDSGSHYSESIGLLSDSIKIELAYWWEEVRGDHGTRASLIAIGYGAGYLLAVVLGLVILQRLFMRFREFALWSKLKHWLMRKDESKIAVEFYERMQKILRTNGLTKDPGQTPTEFALATKLEEAKLITKMYNRVRFGGKELTRPETQEIERSLASLASLFIKK